MQVTVDLGHFPEFKDDAAFASGMLVEQSVFTLPGMVRQLCQTIARLGGSEINFLYSTFAGVLSHRLFQDSTGDAG